MSPTTFIYEYCNLWGEFKFLDSSYFFEEFLDPSLFFLRDGSLAVLFNVTPFIIIYFSFIWRWLYHLINIFLHFLCNTRVQTMSFFLVLFTLLLNKYKIILFPIICIFFWSPLTLFPLIFFSLSNPQRVSIRK